VNRIVPYWQDHMVKSLETHREVVVSAHGNSLRGIVKYLKNISNEDIVSLNLPTGIPYIFEFDSQMKPVKDYFLGDQEVIEKLMAEVANQGKKPLQNSR
jgi:2,3-bisphosphoglycerate-dependent phosphoglycerate mutase